MLLQEELRDELFCQLVNQTWLNPNDVRPPSLFHWLSLYLFSCPPSDVVSLLSVSHPFLVQVNAERGWLLLSMCLAVCAPSEKLFPYLLCYVTQHGLIGSCSLMCCVFSFLLRPSLSHSHFLPVFLYTYLSISVLVLIMREV